MPKKLEVLCGERFGSLCVVGDAQIHVTSGGHRKRQVLCRCDCGGELVTRLASLTNRRTTSCGCGKSKSVSVRFIKKVDGLRSKDHPLYTTWKGMRERCNNPKNKAFKHYGGRGIKCCEEWESFEAFAKSVGPRPYQTSTLDRIDYSGDYSPENVRWADRQTQMSNMRSNVKVTLDGETKTASQWARQFGLNPALVFSRTSRGWSIERALQTPSPGGTFNNGV